MMKKEKHWIALQDEFPRIGSGWRQLNVTYGRKWVYIEHNIPGGHTVRYKVPHHRWNTILGTMGGYWKRNNRDSPFNSFKESTDG